MFNVKSFHADDGDSFLISYGDEKVTNILIDGGRGKRVYKELKREIVNIEDKAQKVDAVILTHVDDDHIRGIIELFESKVLNAKNVGCIYFNNTENISEKLLVNSEISNTNISYVQGQKLADFVREHGISNSPMYYEMAKGGLMLGGAKIEILAPNLSNLEKLSKNWKNFIRKDSTALSTNKRDRDFGLEISEISCIPFKEDKSIVNASSIALYIEYKEKSVLMLSDSQPTILLKNLKRKLGNGTHVDLVKVSHHGSHYNTNSEILNYFSSEKYLISCSEGNRHGFPDKESLARIVKNNFDNGRATFFYFNYRYKEREIFTKEELEEYNIRLYYPSDDDVIQEIEL